VILSESEKLANLKVRKELGIDSMVDLIMKDNPGFSVEQAEEKLKRILEAEMISVASNLPQEQPPATLVPEAPETIQVIEAEDEEEEDSMHEMMEPEEIKELEAEILGEYEDSQNGSNGE
jgi:hypothetical protein